MTQRHPTTTAGPTHNGGTQQRRRAHRAGRREAIISAAFDLAQREGVGALTMRRLSSELSIDPAALYRLFGGKDDLLLAVYDRVLKELLECIGALDEDWPVAIRRVAAHLWEIAGRYPTVIAVMSARTTGSDSERRLVELALSTTAQSGLSRADAVLYYRVFVDTTLALCSQRASLALLDAEARATDAAAWRSIYAQLPEDEYPLTQRHIVELAAITDREIYDATVEAVIAAVSAKMSARAQLVSGERTHAEVATVPRPEGSS